MGVVLTNVVVHPCIHLFDYKSALACKEEYLLPNRQAGGQELSQGLSQGTTVGKGREGKGREREAAGKTVQYWSREGKGTSGGEGGHELHEELHEGMMIMEEEIERGAGQDNRRREEELLLFWRWKKCMIVEPEKVPSSASPGGGGGGARGGGRGIRLVWRCL
ncbi:unnamed protein product [Calypogeia fissa]